MKVEIETRSGKIKIENIIESDYENNVNLLIERENTQLSVDVDINELKRALDAFRS